MTKFVKSFLSNESGATAIEYGLIAALIAVGLIAVLGQNGVGGALQGQFQQISDGLNNAGGGGGGR